MAFFSGGPAPKLSNQDILSWTFDNLKYDENRPIFIDPANPQRFFTASQARSNIRQLIAGLRKAGVRKGDCVVIHAFNDINYPLLTLAIIGVGGVWAGSNPAYSQQELNHHLKTTKARFLISEPEILQPLLVAAKANDISKDKIWIFHPLDHQTCPPEYKSWRELYSEPEEDWVRFDDFETCKNTTCVRYTSSGTTGLPKAVAITHRNLIAEHEINFGELYFNPPYQISHLWSTPLFHAAIGPRALTTVPKRGEIAYIMRRWDLELWLSSVQKYQITAALLVPPQTIAILKSPLTKKYNLKSIKGGITGAAPLSKESQMEAQSLFADDAAFTGIWAMTETCCFASTIRLPERDSTGSVGRLLPGLEAKIVDDDGHDISSYDVTGEMCIRGPTVTPGYVDNPKANEESFDADGFFHTGDIMYCDGKTKLWHIVDRKKELIKVRGFQVAPPEIEAVLLKHPGIADVAVIGVPFLDQGTELPRAYIVRKPGFPSEDLTAEDAKDLVAKNLASYKRLAAGVKFVDAIPKVPSGKILKRLLREDAKKDMSSGRIARL